MDITTLYQLIDQQILSNQEKSLFYNHENGTILSPSDKLLEFVTHNYNEFYTLFKQLEEKHQLNNIIHYLVEKVSQSFTQANQYIYFNYKDHETLFLIYQKLIHELFSNEINEERLKTILSEHYLRLKRFLIETNHHDLFKRYYQSPTIPYVECSDYSAALQRELLHIHLDTLVEPVLDIGCGHEANLVNYLNKKGIQTCGFDRDIKNNTTHILKMDWFEFNYEENQWGTIISHMAFSNHFMHHHLRGDGEFVQFANVFVKILKSLKIKGSFIYAPSLPFMEELIRKNNPLFRVETFVIKDHIHATRITRIE